MKTWIIYFVRMTLTCTFLYLSYLETGLYTFLALMLIASGFEALAFHINQMNKKIALIQKKLDSIGFKNTIIGHSAFFTKAE